MVKFWGSTFFYLLLWPLSFENIWDNAAHTDFVECKFEQARPEGERMSTYQNLSMLHTVHCLGSRLVGKFSKTQDEPNFGLSPQFLALSRISRSNFGETWQCHRSRLPRKCLKRIQKRTESRRWSKRLSRLQYLQERAQWSWLHSIWYSLLKLLWSCARLYPWTAYKLKVQQIRCY